ncbi:MAG: hypothetical protein DMG38_28915 [Acidobacteria bacterium]|nr:MAG: hypothetical protein DMG38_28915 [Acidobacteriota bacterium]
MQAISATPNAKRQAQPSLRSLHEGADCGQTQQAQQHAITQVARALKARCPWKHPSLSFRAFGPRNLMKITQR